MNRIVIIGNGFDLAHGLPSRYEDFLLSLINKSVLDLKNLKLTSEIYQNLFILNRNPHKNELEVDKFDSIEEIKNNSFIIKSPNYSFTYNHYKTETINWTSKDLFSLQFNSKLFHDLFENKNWTDVEKTYFDLLLQILKKHKEEISTSNDLKKLNSDFEEIKRLFIEYIKIVTLKKRKFSTNLSYSFNKCLFKENIYDYIHPIGRADQLLKQFKNQESEKIIIVNFNYTDIIETYVNSSYSSNNLEIINIHGKIDKPESVIFGYGDEMTGYYKQLENLDDENVLKHFKSHYYHANNSYAKLLYEVENHEFDVMVFGHSLGLSDRLLLNTIFENSNCIAIHLFHSGSENHFKKRIALSRHFDNKKEFRKKLVEKLEYLKIERTK